MELMNLIQIERTYQNNGQHAEQIARFNLTGKIEKADNIPFSESADCLDIQIKSARATVCKGTNIQDFLKNDKAKRYGYVTKDFSKMYIMNKIEWLEFINKFGTITRESGKNGGKEKIRLKMESQEMVEWFRLNI